MDKSVQRILLLAVLTLSFSCGQKSSSSNEPESHVQKLYLKDKTNIVQAQDNATLSLKSCRENIAKVVCIVDPYVFDSKLSYEKNASLRFNRPCLSGGEKYIAALENHFDHSSKMLQGMYCSLSKAWIENELISTAYAAAIYDYDTGVLKSTVLGMRRDFFDSGIDMDTWLSWKEEATFGGTPDMKLATSQSLGLIKYDSSQKNNLDFVLADTINHEFGHMFDYANDINSFKESKPEKGSWSALSWADEETPLPKYDFPLRSKLCFYRCYGNFLDSSVSGEIFTSLLKTNFISIYAATNPYEDFAETFGQYISTVENKEFKLSVTADNKTFNLTKHFLSASSKLAYVKKFMKSNYKYPGQKSVVKFVD